MRLEMSKKKCTSNQIYVKKRQKRERQKNDNQLHVKGSVIAVSCLI
jgi:hypothetical protein